jgi:signal transduction histidine kinase
MRKKIPKSLSFRLTAVAAVFSLAALALTGIILASLFKGYIERSFDARLQVYLTSLIASTEKGNGDTLDVGEIVGEPRFNIPLSGWYWHIALKQKPADLLASSRSLFASNFNMSELESQAIGKNGLRRSYIIGPDQEPLRAIERDIQLAQEGDIYSFVVAGNAMEMSSNVEEFNGILILALSMLGVGLVLATFVQVRLGLRPLYQIEKSLAEIRSGRSRELSGSYPKELQPLATELNALISSNDAIVQRSRHHVGNLAHALKTPLSVMANEAEANTGKFSKLVSTQTDIMSEQVTLYLDRARMAASSRVLGAASEVAPTISAILRTLSRIHFDRSIEVEFDPSCDLVFKGEKHDFEELVGNLLDNAFKWADSRVKVTIAEMQSAEFDGDMFILAVDDDGPGLASEMRRKALQRGRRLDETKPGSGLGLAIVTELVDVYGGEMKLGKSNLGGLRVEVRLSCA